MRAIIQHDGREFELPEGHSIELWAGKNGPATYVALGIPGGGSSLFRVEGIDERDDATVVRLGSLEGETPPGQWGVGPFGPAGYAFPDDV